MTFWSKATLSTARPLDRFPWSEVVWSDERENIHFGGMKTHFRPDFRKLRRENFHKEEKSSKILKSKTQLVKLSKIIILLVQNGWDFRGNCWDQKNTLKKVISLMSLGVNLISSNPSLNVSWPRCFRVEGIGGGTYHIYIWLAPPPWASN